MRTSDRSIAAALAAALIALAAFAAQAQTPQSVHYQGFIRNSAGQPVTGSLSITFRIFDASTDGIQYWAETLPNVNVVNGAFSVALGESNPLEDSLFQGVRYLEVQVAGDVPMSPRRALRSVTSAVRAKRADVATQSDGVVYPSPQTGYLGVNAAAFFPSASSGLYGTATGADRYVAAGTELSANVSLPHGVTVTNVSCWVVDNSPSNVVVILGDGLGGVAICGASSSGESSSIVPISGACSHVVNNATQTLLLRFASSCGSNCLLYGCKLTYAYDTEGR